MSDDLQGNTRLLRYTVSRTEDNVAIIHAEGEFIDENGIAHPVETIFREDERGWRFGRELHQIAKDAHSILQKSLQ